MGVRVGRGVRPHSVSYFKMFKLVFVFGRRYAERPEDESACSLRRQVTLINWKASIEDECRVIERIIGKTRF